MKRFTHCTFLRAIGVILLIVVLRSGTSTAQTPLPSPSPAPTPITKTGQILVNGQSTVGHVTKWIDSTNNGTGIIGDSVLTESPTGTVGIGTNPFGAFRWQQMAVTL